MHRLKILVGTILLLFVFGGLLALTVHQPKPKTEHAANFPNPAQEQNPLDSVELRQYLLDQEELKTAIANYFENALASGDIVGAGVSIVKGDSIVLLDGFGKKNIEENTQVDGQTIFRLGSLSKGFAGVLATDLQAEGKICWDHRVREYLPEFQLGDSTHTEKVTIAHILSHTSGTPYHSFTNLVEAGLPLSTIAKRFTEVTPISEPGEMYSYQNAMFALSGEIMERATGQEIGELLAERFFVPLEMNRVITDYDALFEDKNVAIPHTRKRNGWTARKLTDSYHNAIAAGGINASPEDMAKWMRFLLGHNPKVMEPMELAEAFTPRVEINIGRKYYKRWPGHASSHYGFGWRTHIFTDEHTGKRETVWHHGGSVNHFRNEIALYPEADLGICVLLNSHSKLAKTVIPDLHGIVKKVLDQTPIELQNTPKEETASLSFE
ncbi:MAG: serine hydrolase domain-containing protein [Bacteroidota bacterium]